MFCVPPKSSNVVTAGKNKQWELPQTHYSELRVLLTRLRFVPRGSPRFSLHVHPLFVRKGSRCISSPSLSEGRVKISISDGAPELGHQRNWSLNSSLWEKSEITLIMKSVRVLVLFLTSVHVFTPGRVIIQNNIWEKVLLMFRLVCRQNCAFFTNPRIIYCLKSFNLCSLLWIFDVIFKCWSIFIST